MATAPRLDVACELPSWTLGSTTMIVTDPSNPRRIADDPWPYPLSVKVENARSGTWKANAYMGADQASGRVRAFITWEQGEGGPSNISSRTDTVKEASVVRIDTAQVGVFDYDVYPPGANTGDYDNPASFYATACLATAGGHVGGSITWRHGTMGVVVPSGWGDGEYNMTVIRDAESGEAILVLIQFFEDINDNRLERFARDGAEDGTAISVCVEDDSLAMISRDLSYCVIRASEEAQHKENAGLGVSAPPQNQRIGPW